MEYKNVGKSKSSNGAVVSKTEKIYNKKSQSNAGFQHLTMKKRGVYVEKKVKSSTDAQEANGIEIKKKAPPRPRPGQKKFLASVLTILSKSTTGTQYPDIEQDEDRTKVKRSKPRWKMNDTEQSSKTEKKINKAKNSKYKSRVLNDEMLRAEKEQLIILQSKKDITQTPSNYSAKSKIATDSIKWSNMLQENELQKINPIRDILENNIYSGVAESIKKEVLEGRTKEDKKLKINDDPVTLASEIAKEDDKQLYNFFVDLLKTTISVYNVKTDYEPNDGSKIVLEINDSIAKKLEFKNESHENVNYITKGIDETKKKVFHGKENIPIDIKLSEYKSSAPIKRKIRAKSFFNPFSRKANIPPKSNSFEAKKNIRRPKKRALLSLLKEQLEMDTFTCEEPESLYDALKVMARNKQRCEKFIRFDKKSNINKDIDSECMFQRRKVLSFKAKKKGKAKHNTPASEFRNRCDEEVKRTSFSSHHSLEVYGYDYEDAIKLPEEPHRRVIFTYHSSPSGSDSNLKDCNALIDYPDSTASSNNSVFNR